MASKDADAFEKACEKDVFADPLDDAKATGEIRESDSATKVHSVLLEKTTMFSPEVLVNAGVSPAFLQALMQIVSHVHLIDDLFLHDTVSA